MDVLTMVISKMANCISSSGLSRKGLKVILLYCTNNEKEESITVAFCNVLTLNLFCWCMFYCSNDEWYCWDNDKKYCWFFNIFSLLCLHAVILWIYLMFSDHVCYDTMIFFSLPLMFNIEAFLIWNNGALFYLQVGFEGFACEECSDKKMFGNKCQQSRYILIRNFFFWHNNMSKV